jgi:prepilin-type N-terminal cleavage/methylation domain-containing protein
MHLRAQLKRAFTLIELIIVVIVLGILMGIAIPSFLGASNSAHDAAAKANLTTAFKEASMVAAGNTIQGNCLTDTTSDLNHIVINTVDSNVGGVDIPASAGNTLTLCNDPVVDGVGHVWVLTATGTQQAISCVGSCSGTDSGGSNSPPPPAVVIIDPLPNPTDPPSYTPGDPVSPPDGYTPIGAPELIHILPPATPPVPTPDNPVTVIITLPNNGEDPNDVVVWHGSGQDTIGNCDADGVASPDPCVLQRGPDATGNYIVITVLTTQVLDETWSFGYSTPAGPSAPGTPDSFSAGTPNGFWTGGQGHVTYSWGAVDGASSYQLTVDGFNEGTVDGGTTSHDFGSLSCGTSHTFTITAANDGGQSPVASDTLPAVPCMNSQPFIVAAGDPLAPDKLIFQVGFGTPDMPISGAGSPYETQGVTGFQITATNAGTVHKYWDYINNQSTDNGSWNGKPFFSTTTDIDPDQPFQTISISDVPAPTGQGDELISVSCIDPAVGPMEGPDPNNASAYGNIRYYGFFTVQSVNGTGDHSIATSTTQAYHGIANYAFCPE